MIRADKNLFLERLLVAGVRHAMRKQFFGAFGRGLDCFAELDPDRPVIACSNHSNWWDGFIVALLVPLLRRHRIYIAVYETLLARYKPLRYLGAFGLDIDNSPLAGLRYALELLRTPRNVVWLFPQGVLAPQWVPIVVKPGALWLARKSGAQILPVVFRYEWLVESRPSVFINCGRPLPPGSTPGELQKVMRDLYQAIAPRLASPDLNEYRPLFRPKMSMNRRWDWMRHLLRELEGERTPFNPRNE